MVIIAKLGPFNNIHVCLWGGSFSQSALQVCTSHYENIMFRAAMLCAFFGFMRVGEFAANSKRAIQDSILQIKDIRFCLSQPTGLSVDIVLQRSKANQLGPPQLIHLYEATDKNLCPVHALHAFVIMRPKHQGILFCHFDGTPLTKFQFGAVLQKALVQAGLEGQHFRTHSFRTGAATTAFEYGVPLSSIPDLGRWRSQAVLTYIRPDTLPTENNC